MKKSKFLKIAREYQEERRRFKSVNIGDLVWEEGTWGDMFSAIVKAVNVDECYIDVIDLSDHNQEKRYYHFLTKSDMLRKGTREEHIAKEYERYKEAIKKVLDSVK